MLRFDGYKLADTMKQVLGEKRVTEDSIHHVVTSLIQTSLRGVDSHGINLFPHYCRAVDAGRINKNPLIAIHQKTDAVAVVDADHAFGHHAGAVAMDEAIKMAGICGLGAVSVRNSTHFGAAAYFGLRAPEQGCLGFAFTNADALVKAFGAREAFFGTNPICFTAPLDREGPFCLDMATSLASWNKIQNYRRAEKEIPADWAFDASGKTVTDPHKAVTLNPAGRYKGFGLGMMVDVLCGILAESLVSKDIRPMYEPPIDDSKRRISHFFMAMDIRPFMDPNRFKQSLGTIVKRIRALTPMNAGDEIMVPGDPEKKAHQKRSSIGIPVDKTKYEEFIEVSPLFSEAIIR